MRTKMTPPISSNKRKKQTNTTKILSHIGRVTPSKNTAFS